MMIQTSETCLQWSPSGSTSLRAILSTNMDKFPWAICVKGLKWLNTDFPQYLHMGALDGKQQPKDFYGNGLTGATGLPPTFLPKSASCPPDCWWRPAQPWSPQTRIQIEPFFYSSFQLECCRKLSFMSNTLYQVMDSSLISSLKVKFNLKPDLHRQIILL